MIQASTQGPDPENAWQHECYHRGQKTEEDEHNQSMFLIATDENLTNSHLLSLVIYLK